jgi:UDP-2,3-diacylglucosamine pyrophosphatase LpxH
MLQETPLRSVAAGVPGEGKRPHGARPLFFISDLHLNEAIPHTVAAFEHFIRVTAEAADSVFILGDLFEYWIGDDMLSEPFVSRIAALMHTLSERGIALYIMRSVRDHRIRHAHHARSRRCTLHGGPRLSALSPLRALPFRTDAVSCLAVQMAPGAG